MFHRPDNLYKAKRHHISFLIGVIFFVFEVILIIVTLPYPSLWLLDFLGFIVSLIPFIIAYLQWQYDKKKS